MKKIKSLSWTGICCTLLFIFNAGIVFIGIHYNQIWFLVGGILLSLFQCRLYSFYKLKSNKPSPHIPVSFYHRPKGPNIKTFGEVYAEAPINVGNTFLPGAN